MTNFERSGVMKAKKMLSIVSAVLVCTFSCATSLVSAYTPTSEQVNDYNPKMLVKHYLDLGMDKDEILEQFDTTTILPVELTVQNSYESEIIDFYVENNLNSKYTYNPKEAFVTKNDNSDLSSCIIYVTTNMLKEIMNKEWYVSYEFSVSGVKTAEEIKTIHLDDYRGNVEKNKTDSIQIFVGWNREMSPEEIQEHLSPNAKIIFKMDENPNNVKYYQLEIPKSEAEYYAELYEDKKKEYAVTFISCASFTEEDSLSNSDDAGDVFSDGSIDVTDLTAVSLTLLGDMDLTAEQQKAADVDGDGAVTLADLARLQQYLSKKIDSLR